MRISLELEVTGLEAGLTYILDRNIDKVNKDILVEALQLLASKLGTEESKQGSLLLTGIIEALDDTESFWKLGLTHRGKGEALSLQEAARRFQKDALVALYVQNLIKDGLTQESACVAAEGEFSLKLSTVKAILKRAQHRALKKP